MNLRVFEHSCSIGEFPIGCIDDPNVECIRGQSAHLLEWYLIPIVLTLTFIGVTATYMTYTHGRDTIHQSSRYSFESSLDLFDLSSNRRQQQEQEQQQQRKLVKEMGIQAVLYTVVYLNTATWPGVGATVTMVTADIQSRVGEPLFFVLLVFIHLFYPLQGFGNFFVYNHFQITLQKWLREKDHSYCRQCFDWTRWNATNRSQSAPKTSSDAQTMKSSPGPTQKVNKQELLPTSGEEGRV